MGYIFFALDNGSVVGRGPVATNLGLERTGQLRSQLGLNDGDAVFFVAGEPQSFVKFAGAARTKIGEELGLIEKNCFELCWIVDFPMYEWNEEEKEDRLFPQPLLDAEFAGGGVFGARCRRSRQDSQAQGDPI